MNIPTLPHILKYMGSKREILPFVIRAIKTTGVESDYFCDLFAGTSIVGSSFKHQYRVHINDIQAYSSVFAQAYLYNLKTAAPPNITERIYEAAITYTNELKNYHPDLIVDYADISKLSELQLLEEKQRALVTKDFHTGFHLFTKYYSGTYWSYEQCLWIDAIRTVAEAYRNTLIYGAIISALIYAMSYTSQGTGHFAQYRDITAANMQDVLIYRTKQVCPLFEKKFQELLTTIDTDPRHTPHMTSLNYLDCLKIVEPNSIVYADPPYSAVHYSRFYHAIETLVKYDYPDIRYKGRYRSDRYQSPFCIKTQVHQAFKDLFLNIKERKTHLFLSYSDSGMISITELKQIAHEILGHEYQQILFDMKHLHSRMGSSDSYGSYVKEYILAFTLN
ncbi:MAG: DNA adenine methylase [Akkermansia sp.]